MLTAPLSGEEADAISTDANDLARGFVIGKGFKRKSDQSDKPDKSDCTSCCDPMMNYRLPTDFWGYDAFVEYLLWQVQEQPTYFVTNNTPSTFDNNYPFTYAQGTLRSQKFNWSSGVRVGFGYSFERDTWQVLGQYTWYKTEGNKAYKVQTPLRAPNGSFVSTNYLMPLNFKSQGVGVANASSSGYFSYQMADLLLSSAFLATKHIQFNYSFGLTGGYIKQNQNVVYVDAPALPSPFPLPPNNAYWHNHWKFGGGGLRAGVDTNWHVGRGFGLFGKMSFAAILGQYKNHLDNSSDGPFIALYDFIIQDTDFEGILLLPTSQFILGFDWTKTFTNCWISAVKISLAGEFNYLSNLQQTFQSNSDLDLPISGKPTLRDVGNVYMYGGTAHAGADF
jgi:hypothetical protein